MGMPKSVTKVSKDGVKFTSNVERFEYTIDELVKAALRDTAKLIRNRMKKLVPVWSGVLKSNIATWVRKDKATGKVWLQAGVYNRATSKKKGKTPVYHMHLLEFGTSKMDAQPYMKPATFDNINEIRTIQAKYLSAIEDDLMAESLIQEGEEIAED